MNTSRVAVLTTPKNVDILEYPIPKIGDDEILVKVEGCGICGTDVHEYNHDPFGICPIVLGHEGTGEIVDMGKNIKNDTGGKTVKVGDKVVSSVLVCGTCGNCITIPERANLCNNLGVSGLIAGDAGNLDGWFADYIILKKGATFFNVSNLNLEQRMLLEPACVTVHSLERAKTTNLLKFNSTVLVQGCGPIGLLQIAVLKAYGITNIIALDGNEPRLLMAKEMGASHTINFNEKTTLEDRIATVNEMTNGIGADFVFQCTGNPVAASEAFKYVKRGGGLCELGFFVNIGEASYNPHFDICNKEITVVGSW
ncbi:MAG: alcohol dehydrogenase catalytic domain-containing protein, partial [Oscillospiraceae bacterium]